jgi:hypothetical protein
MNDWIGPFLITVSIIFLVWVAVSKENSPEAVATAEARAEVWQNTRLDDMIYYKDVSTNPPLCFSYVWIDLGYGGAGVSNVPCANVPNAIEFRSNYD